MAIVIPKEVHSRKDVSAPMKRVANALRMGLDDDATAYYEPPFDVANERPDFIVIDPNIGVLVVVVVDARSGDKVLGALRGELRVLEHGVEVAVESPLVRATRFVDALRVEMAGRPHLGGVPVGGLAVIASLNRTAALDLELDSLLDLDYCLFKAELDAVISGDEVLLAKKFSRILEGGVAEPMSDETVAEMRALVHPEVVIESSVSEGSLFSAAVVEGDDTIKVMDRRQESMARSIGSGHRVIRGVAGSGKTLVLVHRARLMAKLLPGKKILVTCYTKSLASQLRAQLADCENIEVTHLDRVMAQVISQAGMESPGPKGDWDAVPGVAMDCLRASNGQRYRAVMIDEAQDFDTLALQFCVELLEASDAAEQDLIIVADSAQNIFRKKFSWKAAGINAQGRTQILRVNYRNTKEILTFAHEYLAADPGIETNEAPEFDDEMAIIPPESSERSGPIPTVAVVENVAAEIQAVVATVKGWLNNRSKARSIAVLYGNGSADNRASRLVKGLEEAGVDAFWVTDPANPSNKDQVGSVDEPVIVSTIQSAKGLEFPKVVVCGLGSSFDRDPQGATATRKLLYVGFTRAVDELTVVTTADNPFAAGLKR